MLTRPAVVTATNGLTDRGSRVASLLSPPPPSAAARLADVRHPDVATAVDAVARLLFCDTEVNTAGPTASCPLEFRQLFLQQTDHSIPVTKVTPS